MTTTNQRAVEVLAEMRDLGTPPCSFAHDHEELDALNLAIEALRTPGWRPISEGQVEAAAEAIAFYQYECSISFLREMGKGGRADDCIRMARAALSTLPPAPGEG
jgi:hypothetical protein